MLYIANCIFAWGLVILSLSGYFVFYKRSGEKWTVLVFLAVGWFFLAVAQTIFLTGIELDLALITTLWLMSYILIMTSIVQLFFKVVRLNSLKRNNTP
jgi:hypothetical protein